MNLRQVALKELEKAGFIKTPDNWYQYFHPDIAGGLNVSCHASALGKNNLSIFMKFDNPVLAQKTGFSCNPHSGKYNFVSNTTESEILYIFEHLLAVNKSKAINDTS